MRNTCSTVINPGFERTKKNTMISDGMNMKYHGKKEKERIQKSLYIVKSSSSNGSIMQAGF